MTIQEEELVRVWASNGTYVIIPESVMSATIVSECSHLTDITIPKRAMDAARKAINLQPKQPSKKMRETLRELAKAISDAIGNKGLNYDRASNICAQKYADYQVMFNLR